MKINNDLIIKCAISNGWNPVVNKDISVHRDKGHSRWISREYSLKELEEWNKELKLDNTLEDLGICS